MTNATKKIRDFYAAPGLMTSAGKYKGQMKNLPDDIGELARIVQGLIVHQFVAEPFMKTTTCANTGMTRKNAEYSLMHSLTASGRSGCSSRSIHWMCPAINS